MSSATSSFAQIAGRVKFLLTTQDISGYVVDGLRSTLATSVNDLLVDSEKVAIDPSTLLKDLGRQIVLYNDALPGSPHLATFRQVQVVSGPTTEGVDGGAPGPFLGQAQPPSSYFNTCYVCVSSSDPAVYPVGVVRTG
jgi:hypothetical protein